MNTTLEKLAETEQLGKLIAGFGRSKSWMCWILKICVIVFPLALLSSIAIIGIPILITDFYFVYWSIKGMRAGKILFLYEYGLIDRINSKPQVIRYEDITTFWKSITRIYNKYGSYRNTQAIYTLQTKEDKKRKYVFMAEPENLGNLLSERILTYQFPSAMIAYQAGNPINFGKVMLHQGGISWNKKTLNWTEVETVTLNSGVVYIRKTGKRLRWAAIKVAEFPNVDLFLAMVSQIHPT
jgi:hypothetical protein